MPKVKMKTSMAGHNFSYAHGEVVEVPDEHANAWVEAEIADFVEEPKKKTTLKKGDEE